MVLEQVDLVKIEGAAVCAREQAGFVDSLAPRERAPKVARATDGGIHGSQEDGAPHLLLNDGRRA